MDDLITTPREQHNWLGTFATWSGGHSCSSWGQNLFILKKNGWRNDNIIYPYFQLFVNDFNELYLFQDLKFTLILVWFPWVIPISLCKYLWCHSYFKLLINILLSLSHKPNGSWTHNLALHLRIYTGGGASWARAHWWTVSHTI